MNMYLWVSHLPARHMLDAMCIKEGSASCVSSCLFCDLNYVKWLYKLKEELEDMTFTQSLKTHPKTPSHSNPWTLHCWSTKWVCSQHLASSFMKGDVYSRTNIIYTHLHSCKLLLSDLHYVHFKNMYFNNLWCISNFKINLSFQWYGQ